MCYNNLHNSVEKKIYLLDIWSTWADNLHIFLYEEHGSTRRLPGLVN